MKEQEGIVIKSTGSWYAIRNANGVVLQCRIVGKLRLEDSKSTNPIAVGDRVRYTLENENEGIISEVLKRTNYVVRQSPRKQHNVHLIASNIDQAVLVSTIVAPLVKVGFIDRFLMMTEPYNIPVTIVFNKLDLYRKKELTLLNELTCVYETIGYRVLGVSAETGEGIEALRLLLKDKITLISGQSGVGKTSMINIIEPLHSLRTGEISDYSGKGQHTTTFAEMLPLGFGGDLIDTPGIKTLGFNHFEVMDVVHNFKEIFAISDQCKFGNCTHRNEPKCAVKAAIDEGSISEMRYTSYLNIIEEIEDQNYWERHKDI